MMRKLFTHKTFLLPLLKEFNFLIKIRTMFTAKNLAKKAVTRNTNFFKENFAKRTYVSMHCGKFKSNSLIVKNPVTDKNTPIQGNVFGYHTNVFVSTCKEEQCKTTNCANSNKVEPNPCGKSINYHQGFIQNDPNIINKLGGTLTHKIPKHMKRVTVNPQVNATGEPNDQKCAMENYSTTLKNTQDFIKNSQQTLYAQENNHTSILLKALPNGTFEK